MVIICGKGGHLQQLGANASFWIEVAAFRGNIWHNLETSWCNIKPSCSNSETKCDNGIWTFKYVEKINIIKFFEIF